jgi:hypothetical protein
VLSAAGWGLARAISALRTGSTPRHRLAAASGVTVRLAAVALLSAIPQAAGYGWAGAWVWAPDLTLVLGVLVALLLLTMVLRLAILLRRRAAPDPPGRPRRTRTRSSRVVSTRQQ